MKHLHLAITGALAVAVVVLGVLLFRQGRTAGEPPAPGPAPAEAVGQSAPQLAEKKAAGPEVPANVAFEPDLVYSQLDKPPLTLMLDLAQPKDRKGPFPAVILLHGSGPLTKGKKGLTPLALELAQKGYVTLAVQYRYEREHVYPAAIEDARAALRWLQDNAARYNMDEDRVGVIGFSGGGALACRLGMEKPIRVQAVASYFAPSDLALLHKNAGLAALFIRPRLDQWLGGPPDKVPQKYAEASPLSCVCKEAAPILLLHGSRDGVVPLEHSQLLCRELRKVGANVTFLTFDNAPHDFDERRDTSARSAAAAVEVFLTEHLQRRPAAPRPPP